jgi:hypothetical protein
MGDFDCVSGLNPFLNTMNSLHNENDLVCFPSPLMAKM